MIACVGEVYEFFLAEATLFLEKIYYCVYNVD